MLNTCITDDINLCINKQYPDINNKGSITSKKYSYAAAVLKKSEILAIVDSGTTGHFLQLDSTYMDKVGQMKVSK